MQKIIYKSSNKINSNLTYKKYTATSLHNILDNTSIAIYANKYECKVAGFIQIKAGTHSSGIIVFKSPIVPKQTIYVPRNGSDGGAFYIDINGSVIINGSFTLSSAKYFYFNFSFSR